MPTPARRPLPGVARQHFPGRGFRIHPGLGFIGSGVQRRAAAFRNKRLDRIDAKIADVCPRLSQTAYALCNSINV